MIIFTIVLFGMHGIQKEYRKANGKYLKQFQLEWNKIK